MPRKAKKLLENLRILGWEINSSPEDVTRIISIARVICTTNKGSRNTPCILCLQAAEAFYIKQTGRKRTNETKNKA